MSRQRSQTKLVRILFIERCSLKLTICHDLSSIRPSSGHKLFIEETIQYMLQYLNQFIVVQRDLFFCPQKSYLFIFLLWRCDPTRVMAYSFLRFLDHTQRRTTVGRTPLDEWSARRKDLYLTAHNTHNKQISMPPCGIRTHDLSRLAAADLRLRPRGHWDRHKNLIITTYFFIYWMTCILFNFVKVLGKIITL